MATEQELADFLQHIERKTYKHAMYAVRNNEAALDIVQDAMIKLAEKYGDKPPAELPLLFHRILQNTINDYFRKEKIRNTWVSLFSQFTSSINEDDFDILEIFPSSQETQFEQSPADIFEQKISLQIIEQAIEKLPTRQREAFLMRYWEEMDVAETAAAMGCSAGSVKTHCSRATQALAKALKAKGINL